MGVNLKNVRDGLRYNLKYLPERDVLLLTSSADRKAVSVSHLRLLECCHRPVDPEDKFLFERAAIRSNCKICCGNGEMVETFRAALGVVSSCELGKVSRLKSYYIKKVDGKKVFFSNPGPIVAGIFYANSLPPTQQSKKVGTAVEIETGESVIEFNKHVTGGSIVYDRG